MTEIESNYIDIVRLMYSFSEDASKLVEPVSLSYIDDFITAFYQCVDYDLVAKISGKNITAETVGQLALNFSKKNCKKIIDPYDLDYADAD